MIQISTHSTINESSNFKRTDSKIVILLAYEAEITKFVKKGQPKKGKKNLNRILNIDINSIEQ